MKLLDFTPMESIIAATAGVAKLFMREDELGKVLPGYFADCILVDTGGGSLLNDITVLQDHDKLNVIMINGRIHKASHTEFVKPEILQAAMNKNTAKMQNFIAYELKDNTGRTRMGHLDREKRSIQPLAFKSGTPVENLYQIFEIGEGNVVAQGEPFDLSSR